MRYKQPSKMVKCEICDHEYRARGLKAHMRLKHQLVIKVTEKVIDLSEHLNSDSSQNGKDLSDELSEQSVSIKGSASENKFTPESMYSVGGKFGDRNLFGFKDYFLTHKNEAKNEWAKLIETRFKAGDISWTTNWKSQALDLLSFGDSPLFDEFEQIKQQITKKCTIEVEKYIAQYGRDALTP